MLLCENLKSNPWTLVPDETTDRSTETKLALGVQYFDPNDFKLKIDVLALVKPVEVTATGNIFFLALFHILFTRLTNLSVR